MYNPEKTTPTTSQSDRTLQRVLVTGGAGFLGSHLCNRLVREGHDVYCLDNLDTGSIDNIEHLEHSGNFHFFLHDVLDTIPEELPHFSQIFNLACPASPVHYQRDPVKTALICSRGTMNVLTRALRDQATFLHASTSEIYGDPLVHPQREEYWGNVNTTGPRSCYDEGKRFSETLISDFARQTGLSARIIRIFNTYGPRMQFDDGRVVSNFVVQALKDEPLTIYGAGTQTRSFCYVDDLIEGFLRAMSNDAIGIHPINLGNPQEHEVRELAELVLWMTGSSSRIVQLPLPIDDPRRRRPDITQAQALLGWRPVTPLHLGLEKTIREFSTRLAGTVPHHDRTTQPVAQH